MPAESGRGSVATAAEGLGSTIAASTSAITVADSLGAGPVTLGSEEIRHFAVELSTQLFQHWQVALQEQFRAELGLRLEAELESRQHLAEDLREEVQFRESWFDNPWPRRHGPFGFETWQMEQTIRRQSSELAQTEREMARIRDRLRHLGRSPEGITVTVDEPDNAPPIEGARFDDQTGAATASRQAGRSDDGLEEAE